MSQSRVRLAALSACFLCASALAAEGPFDLIIANGHIIDGTGSPWYSGDVGIRGGRIAAIGNLAGAAAKRRIDAAGDVVAPGFIDMLGQSEFTILVDPRLPSKIYQGITTEITGEGNSAGPMIGQARVEAAQTLEHYGLKADWQSLGEYFARLERQGIGINLASYVGATTVREIVIGDENRPPTAAELARMQALVREAMEQGAVGVSTALEYAPAPYASTEELIALASAAAPYGGIYATHMRSEGDGIYAALDETFRIAREAHISTEIWHLKVAGKGNWGHMPDVDQAHRGRACLGSRCLREYLCLHGVVQRHVRLRAAVGARRGQWENARASEGSGHACPHHQGHQDPERHVGQRMGRGSGTRNRFSSAWSRIRLCFPCRARPSRPSPSRAARTRSTPCSTSWSRTMGSRSARYSACRRTTWRSRWCSPGCRSTTTAPAPRRRAILGEEHPHPRAYGTFPRILRKYVREEHRLRLEDAIRKFSALPAQRMRLTDRGASRQPVMLHALAKPWTMMV